MIASLFRAEAVVVEAPPSLVDDLLLPDERAYIRGAAPGRRAEFGTARVLARRALAALGLPPVSLVPRADRAPVWPAGVAGSIAHGAGRCAVVLERSPPVRAVGLDIEAVSRLVYLHLRFHTYQMGWTDSAVRRFVRDAGPLLPELIELTRCDCTTRNERKARQLAGRMDELEARITELAAQEELAAIRPDLDGRQVMAHLGLEPGPVVGEALDFLLELRLDEGPLGEAEAYRRLDAWWSSRS